LRKGITEGISLPGIGHQILSKEIVNEAIIISDMYDLNEYMALDLLCTGKSLTVGSLTYPVFALSFSK
jgi:nuclear pore complex protein Nup205